MALGNSERRLRLIVEYDGSSVRSGTAQSAADLRGLANVAQDLGAVGDAGQQVGAGLDQAGRGARQATGGMEALRGQIVGLAASYGALQIAQGALELAQLGSQSRQAEAGLRAFSGGAEAAAANVRAVRAASSGLLSEFEATQQASLLLSLGMAQNSEELGRFTDIAVTLGSARGKGASESIEQLSLAIANLSYERLDSLGISAQQVRERVAELKEEGKSTEEAFRLATLEEGAAKLATLEQAGFRAASGLDVLGAALTDIRVGIGETLAGAVDGAVGSLDAMGVSMEELDFQRYAADAMNMTLNMMGVSDALLVTRQGADEMTASADAANSALLETGVACEVASGGLMGVIGSALSLTGELYEVANAARVANLELAAMNAQRAEQMGRVTAIRTSRGAKVHQGGGTDMFSANMGLEDSVTGYLGRTVDANIEANRQIAASAGGTMRSVGRAHGQAATEAERAARETQRAYESAVGQIRSAVSSNLDLSGNIGSNDALLDQFGMRQEGTGEIVRRLQDVVNRGSESEWADYYAALLGITPEMGDEVKARAAAMIQDIQAGLRPDLIDTDALLEQTRRSLTGQRNIAAKVEEVTQQLVKEGFTEAEIGGTLGQALGPAMAGAGEQAGTDLVGAVVAGTQAELEAKKEEVRSLGAQFMAAMLEGARAGAVNTGIVDAIIAAVEDEVLGTLAEAAETA